MIDKLVKLANHLDSRGFTKEADYLDKIIKTASMSQKIADIKKSLNDAQMWLSQIEGVPGKENFSVDDPYHLYLPDQLQNDTGISSWNFKALVEHYIGLDKEMELIDALEKVEWISPQKVIDGKINTWVNATGEGRRPLMGRPLRDPSHPMPVEKWYTGYQEEILKLLNSAETKAAPK